MLISLFNLAALKADKGDWLEIVIPPAAHELLLDPDGFAETAAAVEEAQLGTAFEALGRARADKDKSLPHRRTKPANPWSSNQWLAARCTSLLCVHWSSKRSVSVHTHKSGISLARTVDSSGERTTHGTWTRSDWTGARGPARLSD